MVRVLHSAHVGLQHADAQDILSSIMRDYAAHIHVTFSCGSPSVPFYCLAVVFEHLLPSAERKAALDRSFYTKMDPRVVGVKVTDQRGERRKDLSPSVESGRGLEFICCFVLCQQLLLDSAQRCKV